MIFTSLALFSGIFLFSSAAPTPWSSTSPAPVTHWVNVSNDAAGLLYDPPFIVSQPTGFYISNIVLTCHFFQTAAIGDIVSFKFHPKNHTVTQSSFGAPCTPLHDGTDTGLCVLSYLFKIFMFSDVFVPHSMPVTLGTPDDKLPVREFIVEDVRIPLDFLSDDGTNCPF